MDSVEGENFLANAILEYNAEILPPEIQNVLSDYFVDKQCTRFKTNLYNASEVPISELTEFCLKKYKENDLNDSSEIQLEYCTKSITENLVDVDASLIDEKQYLKQYFPNGCGCARKCHLSLPWNVAFRAHLDALHLDQYCPSHVNHQHLLLLGAMNALMKTQNISISKNHQQKDRLNTRTLFKFCGKDVCRNFFLFVFGCGEKRIRNVTKQFLSNGIMPKQHESAILTKNLVKLNSECQRREALLYMFNYAQQNALQLNGRYSLETSNCDLYLYPNQLNLTRRYIFDQYVTGCNELHWEPISFALWNELWDLKYPNIMTINNRNDICFECRKYQQNISITGTTEISKLLKSKQFLNHLNYVQNEIEHHRTNLNKCLNDYQQLNQKTDFESSLRENFISSLPTMHYTFDWYSTISLPYCTNSSSIYFQNGYKVALFGITIQPLKKFVLYIVPEFICHQSESIANITISLMHHFFTNIHLNVKEIFINFANNDVEQAKHNLILCYFMWRTLYGFHDKVNVSYFPSGHSRCWNDLFMGLFKKKFRNFQVNTLADVKLIGERCISDSENNSEKIIQAILVGDDEEVIQVSLYDWQKKFFLFQKLNTNILVENNHFEINIELPGFILCRNGFEMEIVSYNLLCSKNLSLIDQEMPEKLRLEPLSTERRQYLHKTIRKYFTTEHAKNSKLWTSLADNEMLEPKRKALNETKLVKKKSLPTCGYCKMIGHRESTFGKVRCPLKKKDCSIMETKTISIVSDTETKHSVIDIAASAIVQSDDSFDLIEIDTTELEQEQLNDDSDHIQYPLSDYNILVEDIDVIPDVTQD